MKPLPVVLFTLVILVSSIGLASAEAETISATGQVFWTTTPNPGNVVDVTINFQSSSSQELSLYRIGIHADWQQAGYYYSKTFSSNPPIVHANGLYSVTIPLSIPVNATLGQHTLIISADGYTANGDTFNWDSTTQSFNVGLPSTSPTTTSTISPTVAPIETTAPTLAPIPTTSTISDSSQETIIGLPIVFFVIILAIIAVVAIVAIVAIIKR